MSETTSTSQPVAPEKEHYPAFEDSDITVLEGKTMSKSGGWWSAILLVKTYGKIQIKWYLWQYKEDKKVWKRKQSYTINPFNWVECKKVTDEYLEKRKTIK